LNVKISVGASVTFSGDFTFHPLRGGEAPVQWVIHRNITNKQTNKQTNEWMNEWEECELSISMNHLLYFDVERGFFKSNPGHKFRNKCNVSISQ
jgi:hypothetical protein